MKLSPLKPTFWASIPGLGIYDITKGAQVHDILVDFETKWTKPFLTHNYYYFPAHSEDF